MPFAQWGYHPELGRGDRGVRSGVPRRLHLRGDRSDARVVLHADGRGRAALRRDGVPQRRLPRAHRRRPTAARCRSRSGNMFDPWEALDRQGADALRWFMLTNGSPWASRRIGHEVLDEVLRQFLLTLWNVYAFFVTYANAEGFDPGRRRRPPRPTGRCWTAGSSRSSRTTVAAARDGLEAYDATGAGRAIQAFVDDLSNWYVRRSRRRFWNPGGERDADARRGVPHALRVPRRRWRRCSRRSPRSWPRRCGGTSRRDATARPTRCTSPTTRAADDGAPRCRPRRGDGRRARDRGARPHGPRRDQDEGAPAAVGGGRALRRRPRARSPRSSTWSPTS